MIKATDFYLQPHMIAKINTLYTLFLKTAIYSKAKDAEKLQPAAQVEQQIHLRNVLEQQAEVTNSYQWSNYQLGLKLF